MAVLDQTLLSGTNFLTLLLVGRSAVPAEFGVFVVVYTGLWMFQAVQGALIVEPMNVLAAPKEGDDYRSYTTNMFISQVLFATVAGLVILALGAVLVHLRSVLFAFAFAVVSWQIQEFVRRVFYNRTRVGAGLMNDVISYGGQIILLAVLYAQGVLTPVSALVAAAVTSALAAVVGGWQVRHDLTAAFGVHSLWRTAAVNWRFGRWLLGANAFRVIANRCTVFIVVGFIGPVGMAGFAAASVLSRVPEAMMLALETMLPPLMSRRFKQKSRAEMERFLKTAALLAGIPLAVLVAILVVFAKEVLHIVYGGTYDEFAFVLQLVSLANLITFFSAMVRVALKVVNQTRVVFIASAASAVLLVTVGSLLTAVAGIGGAAWVPLLVALSSLVVLATGYWRVTQGRSAKLGVQ